MIRNWYVRFSDSRKSEKVSFSDYCMIHKMAIFYDAVVSDNFCPKGKSLRVSFPKHFL